LNFELDRSGDTTSLLWNWYFEYCIRYRSILAFIIKVYAGGSLFILPYPFVLNWRMSNHYMQKMLCSSSATVALWSIAATVTRDRLQDFFIRCFVRHQENRFPSRTCVVILRWKLCFRLATVLCNDHIRFSTEKFSVVLLAKYICNFISISALRSLSWWLCTVHRREVSFSIIYVNRVFISFCVSDLNYIYLFILKCGP